MRKRNSVNSNYERCCICFPTDDQVIFILDSLLQQIFKIFIQLKKQITETQTSKLQPLDFGRLIKMVFNKRFKNIKATSCCKHLELKKDFTSKLNCSQKQLDRASSALSWKLAKFQFHTDVIISQSKSFIRHFTQKQDSKQSEVQQSNKKGSSVDLQDIKQQNQQNQGAAMIYQNHRNLPTLNQTQEGFYNTYPYLWQISWPTHMLMTNPQIEVEHKIQKFPQSSQISPNISSKGGKNVQARYKQ